MEEQSKSKIDILDKGYVMLIDYMGNDDRIAEAARVSYATGTKSVSSDEGLIRYLMRHKHSSPFEMVNFTFEVRAPIFVARQWLRHRTAKVNEESARYSILLNDMYVPEKDRLQKQSTTNKQGSEQEVVDNPGWVQEKIREGNEQSYQRYDILLQQGLTRELSRGALNLNTYTRWIWTIDLHNLFHFLKLRTDSHAQWEIRVFAEAIETFVKQVCPIAYEAYIDYSKESITLSKVELEYLQSGTWSTRASKREIVEFRAKKASLGID